MPFQIKHVNDKYKLYNIKKKEFVNKEFNSKETAAKAGINYGRYRKEKLILKGNKLIKANDK